MYRVLTAQVGTEQLNCAYWGKATVQSQIWTEFGLSKDHELFENLCRYNCAVHMEAYGSYHHLPAKHCVHMFA